MARMSFFESLLALLATAILLLQVSRRLAIPYPTMLAAAGVGLALIPGMPRFSIDPHTALALFIAPALVDAAFDFPIRAMLRLWRPLFSLAVVVVLLSAGIVAWLGVARAGLPLFAAIALGAIVAPPDAAAATAILSNVRMPLRSIALLKGESLLNDAAALLLFGAATAVQTHGGIDTTLGLKLLLAAPGGILAGILLAKLVRLVNPFVTGTLGGNLMEFVTCFGVWVLAERAGLSPVLCLVAFAMTLARTAGLATRPRMRIHSFAVWETVVFLLNVLAFLLMGLQARSIVGGMAPARLHEAARFAGVVVLTLIVVRMAWVLIYNRLAVHFSAFRGSLKPSSFRQGILIGWSGMRGLVTLATAFALPADFPQRDLIVLTAFSVVLATLIFQGLTLGPLVHLLGLDGENGLEREIAEARAVMLEAALKDLEGQNGPAAHHWRWGMEVARNAVVAPIDCRPLHDKRKFGLAAMRRQRETLEQLRSEERVSGEAFLILQEDLDFMEVSISAEVDRQIVES